MGVVDGLLAMPQLVAAAARQHSSWATVGSTAHAAGLQLGAPSAGEVAWAAALGLLLVLVVLASHWRRAIGSHAIPAGTRLLPGALPLIGHAASALPNMHRLHEWLLECTRQMGEGTTWALSLPFLPTSFMVTDPACLQYVLKQRAGNFTKGSAFPTNFGPVLGHGIFVADGPSWYWQRKLATNIFSVKSFKRYIEDVFEEKMELLARRLGEAAQAHTAHQAAAGSQLQDGAGAANPAGPDTGSSSSSPGVLDLHDLMYRFTLDSFGQIAFGSDPGCLAAKGKVAFASAFDAAQVIVNERFWLPGWQLLQLLNGDIWRLRRHVATIRSFARGIIACRRTQLAAAAAANKDSTANNNRSGCKDGNSNSDDEDEEGVGGARHDLLSLFMESAGPDGRPLAERQLIDTVINFIIAGRDTTAQALSWSFFLLMQHPEVEARLLAEVRAVLGDAAVGAGAGSGDGSGSGGVLRPSYDQLRQLRYARAVFLEALRLYPSVPENAKYPTTRDTLPDGTVVPAGAQVIYSAYVCNRLERTWGPDAAVFRPERWLEMGAAPTPYQYLTFNAGPRLCLGQRLAELEGVFVLTGLLSRFAFTRVDSAPITYTLSPTMPMQRGLMVTVAPRTSWPEAEMAVAAGAPAAAAAACQA